MLQFFKRSSELIPNSESVSAGNSPAINEKNTFLNNEKSSAPLPGESLLDNAPQGKSMIIDANNK